MDPALVRQDSFADWVKAAGVDLLLNAHSLHIASPAVTAAPRIGSFNLHPGPLPEYRGLNAPSWAIFDGRVEHAVTLHWMTGSVDAGPIAYESRFKIDPDATGLKLSTDCVTLGIPLIGQLLEDAASGRVPLRAQEDRPGDWHGREVPNDGWVDWTWPAQRIAAFLRAAYFHPLPSPWGRPRTRLGPDRTLELVMAEVDDAAADADPGHVWDADEVAVKVGTAKGSVVLRRVRHEGKAVPATAILGLDDRLS